jgi:hypothetical protein
MASGGLPCLWRVAECRIFPSIVLANSVFNDSVVAIDRGFRDKRA